MHSLREGDDTHGLDLRQIRKFCAGGMKSTQYISECGVLTRRFLPPRSTHRTTSAWATPHFVTLSSPPTRAHEPPIMTLHVPDPLPALSISFTSRQPQALCFISCGLELFQLRLSFNIRRLELGDGLYTGISLSQGIKIYCNFTMLVVRFSRVIHAACLLIACEQHRKVWYKTS